MNGQGLVGTLRTSPGVGAASGRPAHPLVRRRAGLGPGRVGNYHSTGLLWGCVFVASLPTRPLRVKGRSTKYRVGDGAGTVALNGVGSHPSEGVPATRGRWFLFASSATRAVGDDSGNAGRGVGRPAAGWSVGRVGLCCIPPAVSRQEALHLVLCGRWPSAGVCCHATEGLSWTRGYVWAAHLLQQRRLALRGFPSGVRT